MIPCCGVFMTYIAYLVLFEHSTSQFNCPFNEFESVMIPISQPFIGLQFKILIFICLLSELFWSNILGVNNVCILVRQYLLIKI